MRARLDGGWEGWGSDGEAHIVNHVAGLGNGISLFPKRGGLHVGTQEKGKDDTFC